MELTIGERIALSSVLPLQGNAVTLRIIQEARLKLSFTEAEIKDLGIENHMLPQGGANITWNPKKANVTTDIEIGEAVNSIIVKELTRLDATNRLHLTMLPLYKKFVEKEA